MISWSELQNGIYPRIDRRYILRNHDLQWSYSKTLVALFRTPNLISHRDNLTIKIWFPKHLNEVLGIKMQLESECILGMIVGKSIYLISSKDLAEHLRGQTSKICSGGAMVQESEGFGKTWVLRGCCWERAIVFSSFEG